MVEVYLHLLPKVQLHVSPLDNSHLQVVHESLESSYTRFNIGCVCLYDPVTSFIVLTYPLRQPTTREYWRKLTKDNSQAE